MSVMDGAFAGCSAAAWSTCDEKHLFARNFDHTGMAEETGVMYIPRGTVYAASEGGLERRSKYSAVGMGIKAGEGLYAFYDAINEQGLMGAQLYYRGFAHYSKGVGRSNDIQPPLLVHHLLSCCSSVDEAVFLLKNEITVVDTPLMGAAAPLHWMFSDRQGKTVVAEPDKGGISVYTDTAGVMTNSPPYPWHRLNLLNYVGIDRIDRGSAEFGEERIEQCFSGSGAMGLPGDWSSPSRFVRLASMLKYAKKGRNETQGTAYFMRLMNNVAFPLGLVQVTDKECLSDGAPPLDYTVYTSVMCAESLKYYWNTYENQSLRMIELTALKDADGVRIYPA